MGQILFLLQAMVRQSWHMKLKGLIQTGEIIAWVKIPTVSASENTDIYIYYKGTASTPSTVWDSNYKLVYHLNQTVDGTVDEITDASGTGNHGTAGGTGDKTFDASRITNKLRQRLDMDKVLTDQLNQI